jgi:hypothetical protein
VGKEAQIEAMKRTIRAAVVLGLGLVLPAAAWSQPDPLGAPVIRGGDLRITPTMDHLVLGNEDKLTLRITAAGRLEDLELTTNIGKVERPRLLADGTFEALYRPPEQFFPQIAIVSATARSAGKLVHGYRALRLWGKGAATVKTRPRAKVTVRIGSQSHGPVRADAKGVAQVPVVVPPGIRFGWDGKQKVDLNLPPMNHLHLFAVPPRVSGVEGERVAIYLIAVQDNGSARAKTSTTPTIQAFGQPTSLRTVHAGTWRADITVPAGKPAGLTVTASLPGESASNGSIELIREAGGAAKVRLEVPKTVGDDPLTIKARVTDQLGTPVDTPKVEGTCSEGTFEPFVRRDKGEYQGMWRPPAQPKKLHALLQVKAGSARAEARVRFLNIKRPPLRPIWFWTGIATSGVLLATGIATQVVLLNKSSEYKDPATSIERRQELKDGGQTLVALSGVTLGLGAAAAVATTVLYFYTDFETPEATLAAGPIDNGGGVWFSSRW